MNQINIKAFLSFAELMEYDENDNRSVSDAFVKICKALGIEIDIDKYYDEYFDNYSRAGTGDVYVFNKNDLEFLAIDTFNTITDQLDLIYLYIRCDASKYIEIKELLETLVGRYIELGDVFKIKKISDVEMEHVINRENYPEKVTSTWIKRRDENGIEYAHKDYLKKIHYIDAVSVYGFS